MEDNQLEKKISDNIRILKKTFSKDLLSIFQGVKTNNMKTWFSS